MHWMAAGRGWRSSSRGGGTSGGVQRPRPTHVARDHCVKVVLQPCRPHRSGDLHPAAASGHSHAQACGEGAPARLPRLGWAGPAGVRGLALHRAQRTASAGQLRVWGLTSCFSGTHYPHHWLDALCLRRTARQSSWAPAPCGAPGRRRARLGSCRARPGGSAAERAPPRRPSGSRARPSCRPQPGCQRSRRPARGTGSS